MEELLWAKNRFYMTLRGRNFQLTGRDPENKKNEAIDIFFNSLALRWDGCGAGVVLSGAGSDGTNGSLQLHAHGAMIMAQDPKSAIMPSMPEWVIRREHVHVVLPPKQLAQTLVELIKQANCGPFNTINACSHL